MNIHIGMNAIATQRQWKHFHDRGGGKHTILRVREPQGLTGPRAGTYRAQSRNLVRHACCGAPTSVKLKVLELTVLAGLSLPFHSCF